MESLLNTGGGPNVINKVFLPPFWKGSLNSINPLHLETANCEVVDVEGMVPLFIGIGHICIRT